MLSELHITNLAVIEDATIELDDRLNCFTGETGAGKSLVIGAFELLLGLRSATDLLRAGAEEGRVSGVFELRHAELIRRVARTADLDFDDDAAHEQLLITRKLFASGRTSVSVNGRPATMSMLKELGELLVDVHGQHDHQYLLKPAHQLEMLDHFSGSEAMREQFIQTHRHLHDLRRRRAELDASAALRRQQLELYEFQAGEIDEAAPTEGEYDELDARHRVLSNLERIKREAGHAYAAMYDSEGAIVERLQAVVGVLKELGDLDGELKPIADDLYAALAQLQDGSFAIGRYVDRLDLDPAELGDVEQRLNTLNRLVQKYDQTGEGVGSVIVYRQQIESEIQRLRSDTSDQQHIDDQIGPAEAELRRIGQALTAARQAGAKKLMPLIEAQLDELGMADARFDVAFETIDDGADPNTGTEHATGLDTIEMLVQANPGQPALPLRRVASGGELSRIMLALKSILAQADRVSVLVFDEIDANVGGRMGTVLGAKLRDLATHHQVLCITHLPQIAAYADRHLKIIKRVDTGQTATHVEPLADDRRIDELAAMLSGKNATDTTRQQAREMLALAEAHRTLKESAAASPRPAKRPRAASAKVTARKSRPARR